MSTFIFLLIVGTLLLIGLIHAVREDYKRFKNAWSFYAVMGYFFLGCTLTFIACTVLLTVKYGRMTDLAVAIATP